MIRILSRLRRLSLFRGRICEKVSVLLFGSALLVLVVILLPKQRTTPEDLSLLQDLSLPEDLALPKDLAPQEDLALPKDLSLQEDLTLPEDLSLPEEFLSPFHTKVGD